MRERSLIIENERQNLNVSKYQLNEEGVNLVESGKLFTKFKNIVNRFVKKKTGDGQAQQQPTDTNIEIQSSEKDLEELTSKLKSTNLLTYKGQLSAFVGGLMGTEAQLDEFNAADCISMEKQGIPRNKRIPGTSAKLAMKDSIEQVFDMFARVHIDMQLELVNKGLASREESKKTTIEDAIEMLYVRYNSQKSFLKKIATAIIKVSGGYVNGQLLQIVEQSIREKYGETSGRIANSIISDFVGSTFGVSPDESKSVCVDGSTNKSGIGYKDPNSVS